MEILIFWALIGFCSIIVLAALIFLVAYAIDYFLGCEVPMDWS